MLIIKSMNPISVHSWTYLSYLGVYDGYYLPRLTIKTIRI